MVKMPIEDSVLKHEVQCASCGKVTPAAEVHSFLFCALYGLGWSREQIIANTVFTVDVLRDRGEVPPRVEEVTP